VRLRYTLPALADLDSILTYTAEASPQGARRVQKRIQDVIDLLLAHPEIGIRTDDPDIRRLPRRPIPS
jgi:plasmid stabilization system protein ParE